MSGNFYSTLFTYSYKATYEYFARLGYIANFVCVYLKAIGYELDHYLPLPVMIICFLNTSALNKEINNRKIEYALGWKKYTWFDSLQTQRPRDIFSYF